VIARIRGDGEEVAFSAMSMLSYVAAAEGEPRSVKGLAVKYGVRAENTQGAGFDDEQPTCMSQGAKMALPPILRGERALIMRTFV
jgi:hypothetical protein